MFPVECYIRQARKVLAKHPDLARQYQRPLDLLEINPYNPSLRLHPLKARLAGLHAVSINIRYRITPELIIRVKEILLVNVGAHGEVC